MRKRLERMKEQLPGEELLKKPISRKAFVAGAGATSFGLLLAACGGGSDEAATTAAPPDTEAPPADTGETTAAPPSEALKEGLADGMYGGPVGFPGAERYQYPIDSEEGRAISALRQMVQDGTAPDTIIVQALDFAKPQFETPFETPDGTGASIVASVRGGDGDQARVRRDHAGRPSTRRTSATPRRRTAASTPSRRPSRRWATSPRPACSSRSTSTSTSTSRAGAIPSTATQAARRPSRCSRSTRASPTSSPSTTIPSRSSTDPTCSRTQTRAPPSRTSTATRSTSRSRGTSTATSPSSSRARMRTFPLYGDVMTYAPFWCVVNFNQRFVSSANPNMLYFNEDGSANVNNEAGVRAFTEIKENLAFHGPGALAEGLARPVPAHGRGQRPDGRHVPELLEDRPGQPGARHRGRRPVLQDQRDARAASWTARSSGGR